MTSSIGKVFCFLALLQFTLCLSGCGSLTKTSRVKELQLFDQLVEEVKRVDGDGLIPTQNRPDNWNTLVHSLREDLRNAKTKFEVGQVFKRLDLSYPNIHSHITLEKEYDYHQSFGRVNFPFKIRYEEVSSAALQKKLRLVITDIDAFSKIKQEDRPQQGDEILAINNRDIESWHKEAFNFCKYPLEKQCAVAFWDSFRKELFSWNRSNALFLTLRRDGRDWTIQAPLEIPTSKIPQITEKKTSDFKIYQCEATRLSYPEFKLVYSGFNVCAYESKNVPDTVLIKIRSFRYRGLPESAKIQHIGDETSLFWKMYWKKVAPTTKHLIIDVIENMGGSSPIKWYALFFPNKFQEQYVQFKKIKELDDKNFRDALFYSELSKERTFDKWKKSGTYKGIAYGAFLPNLQQFCADDTNECIKEKFQPRDNKFKGKVYIALDQWCHSSCVGFVWNMKNVLKDRLKFFGFPDDGDSTYGRINLDGYLNQSAVKIVSRPRIGGQYGSLGEGAVFTQAVSVSRSTDENGKILSGIPQKVDNLIPLYWNDSWADWEKRTITRIVANIKNPSGHNLVTNEDSEGYENR